MTNKQSQQQQQISDAETIDMLRKMLEVSREKNQKLTEQMEKLNQEHIQLKSFISRANPAFANHIQAEQFQQLMHSQTREQATIAQEQIARDNYDREQKRQLALEEQYQKYKDKVLKQIPYLQQEYDGKVAATQQEKQKHIEAVNQFYDLSESQLQEYVNIEHTLEESAVKHCLEARELVVDVINAAGEQVEKRTGDIIYDCRPCSIIAPETFRTLKAAELHCYYETGHKEDILNLIGQAEREVLAEITADLNKEIRKEVANIQERERRERLVKEHQETKRMERVAKDKLPFV
jgi:hypothetical protein